VTDDVKVRRAICEAHGLDWPAAKFLTGDTVPELEQCAARLAELLHKQPPPEQPQRPPDMFSIAVADKAERKRKLVDALCGRFPQPRDEQGRYIRPATDFSGGARESVPLAPESHEQTLTRVLRSGESDVGARL
jgi:hypothetical protein